MRDTAYFQAAGRFIYACERLNALIAQRSAPGAASTVLPAAVLAMHEHLAAQQAQLTGSGLQPTEEEFAALTAQAETAIRTALMTG